MNNKARLEMRGDDRCIVDDDGIIAVVFGDDATEAKRLLAAYNALAETNGVLAVMDEVARVLEKTVPTPLRLPGESNEHPCRVIGRIGDFRQAHAAAKELRDAAEAVCERGTDSPLWQRLEAALVRFDGGEHG